MVFSRAKHPGLPLSPEWRHLTKRGAADDLQERGQDILDTIGYVFRVNIAHMLPSSCSAPILHAPCTKNTANKHTSKCPGT